MVMSLCLKGIGENEQETSPLLTDKPEQYLVRCRRFLAFVLPQFFCCVCTLSPASVECKSIFVKKLWPSPVKISWLKFQLYFRFFWLRNLGNSSKNYLCNWSSKPKPYFISKMQPIWKSLCQDKLMISFFLLFGCCCRSFCVHNLLFCLCFGLCFWFGLFLGFFGWELGLGEAFLYVAWECLGNAWAPKFPSRIKVCFVLHCLISCWLVVVVVGFPCFCVFLIVFSMSSSSKFRNHIGETLV